MYSQWIDWGSGLCVRGVYMGVYAHAWLTPQTILTRLFAHMWVTLQHCLIWCVDALEGPCTCTCTYFSRD